MTTNTPYKISTKLKHRGHYATKLNTAAGKLRIYRTIPILDKLEMDSSTLSNILQLFFTSFVLQTNIWTERLNWRLMLRQMQKSVFPQICKCALPALHKIYSFLRLAQMTLCLMMLHVRPVSLFFGPNIISGSLTNGLLIRQLSHICMQAAKWDTDQKWWMIWILMGLNVCSNYT